VLSVSFSCDFDCETGSLASSRGPTWLCEWFSVLGGVGGWG